MGRNASFSSVPYRDAVKSGRAKGQPNALQGRSTSGLHSRKLGLQRATISRGKSSHRRHLPAVGAACLTLVLGVSSCVPPLELRAPELAMTAAASPAPVLAAAVSALPAEVPLAGQDAWAANAALPVSGAAGPAASSFQFRPASEIDRLRASDCLAQAIYYEARSESEDGQRAVAQVVLNRVRHPAWPNSVCGVVYQGPMRPGGGCQFTFTCDGSLAHRAAGRGWERARRLAAEFLSGATYAPVGLATHYHTHAVFPAWAPRLLKTNVIGAHNFYRLPGGAGTAGAFRHAYAGREPVPVPSMRLAPQLARPGLAADPLLAVFAPGPVATRGTLAAAVPEPEVELTAAPSTVREEYRNSGQWRADAPAAITGR